jgi:hypothetical protein
MTEESRSLHGSQEVERAEKKGLGTPYTLQRHTPFIDQIPEARSHLLTAIQVQLTDEIGFL